MGQKSPWLDKHVLSIVEGLAMSGVTMPIYEYNCAKCNKHFEVVQKIIDTAKVDCPTCGTSCMRVMSQTSFSLKGGGWYKDGYASSSGGKKTESKGKEKK